jgi:hypothetical protein
MNLLKNGQSGQALVMALVLLALGSLLVVPILDLAGTSLNYHQVIEKDTLETYSADSGVEYALCKLGNDPEGYQANLLQDSFIINSRNVDVSAQYMGNDIYKITSIATTDSNSSTTIESYVHIPPYPSFFNNAITSKGDVTIRPGGEVFGDVQYNGILDNKGTIYGETITDEIKDWPTVEELFQFYWVESPVINETSIDVSSGSMENPYPIGPARTSGDLTLTGSGVAGLNGRLYVQGSLTLLPGTALKLNGETIYAEVNITLQPGTDIYGPGCIIAAGDIDFQPNLVTGEEGFIFLMSIAGEVKFQPGNDFYGCVAGNVDVLLQPEAGLYAAEPDPGFDYPAYTTLETVSYNIN